jgi:hypothetical protein
MLLSSSLELPEVFRTALGDLLPTLPSKLDGGGIFRLGQYSDEVALTPERIMHGDAFWLKPTFAEIFRPCGCRVSCRFWGYELGLFQSSRKRFTVPGPKPA